MIVYLDDRMTALQFGYRTVEQACRKRGIYCCSEQIANYDLDTDREAVVVLFSAGYRKNKVQIPPVPLMEAEAFEIVKKGKAIFIYAGDRFGAMYGLFELAEMIEIRSIEGIEERKRTPFLQVRGVKHNLPFHPYDDGDPFIRNREVMLDLDYWRSYIEMLALNRYNTLSLWSENPFPMMFRLEKYPNTCPLDETELAHAQKVFSFIFRYCRELGISTYIITWNIRICPSIAEGLGLPRQLGEQDARFAVEEFFGKEPMTMESSKRMDGARQSQEVIKDYFKECVRTLCLTYRELTGIGTTSSEEMAGDAASRVQWVKDVYAQGIVESGRTMPFIFRTNSTATAPIVDRFFKEYRQGAKYLSWKYSNAHMWSSVEPEFEKEWHAWDGVDLEGIDILYTVRNDDFHTFRGGSAEFVRAYLRGMKRNPRAKGYYWGADGYVWGKDFQHTPHKHMPHRYDWQRHWFEFATLGRLGYDNDLGDDVWVHRFCEIYTPALGLLFYRGFGAAMHVIPPFQRTNWIDYDFQSHPESLLTSDGFRSVLDFLERPAMPGIGTLSLMETAEAIVSAKPKKWKESSLDCIAEIKEAAATLGQISGELERKILPSQSGGEIACSLLDLKAWHCLALYYAKKTEAALDLGCFRLSGNRRYREEAVRLLTEAVEPYERLCLVWGSHYLPYRMTRSKWVFDYTLYLDEVKKDIVLASGYGENGC